MERQMKCHVIATDLDGTLLKPNGEISAGNIEAIERAKKAGIKVVACSGRSPESISYYAKKAGIAGEGCYGIGFNGGVIYRADTMEILQEYKMSKETTVKAIEIMKTVGPDIPYMVYEKMDLIKYEQESAEISNYAGRSGIKRVKISSFEKELLDDVYKIIIRFDPDKLRQFHKDLGNRLEGVCDVVFSDVNLLEMNPLGINKSTGVSALCGILGTGMENAMCIGDNHNDFEMIRDAGIGVAVANAVDEVKNIAKYVTNRSFEEDAVKEAIDMVLLSRG